jgi:transposase
MTGIKWITRVPLSIKSAQDKILDIQESEWQLSSKKGYKIAERASEYGNIQQRWLVIESDLRKQASIKQIDKEVNKQESSAQASLRKLSGKNLPVKPTQKPP